MRLYQSRCLPAILAAHSLALHAIWLFHSLAFTFRHRVRCSLALPLPPDGCPPPTADREGMCTSPGTFVDYSAPHSPSSVRSAPPSSRLPRAVRTSHPWHPRPLAAGGPSFLTSDGSPLHSPGLAGFYFLPPTVRDKPSVVGTFDPCLLANGTTCPTGLDPIVRICLASVADCGAATPVATFTHE